MQNIHPEFEDEVTFIPVDIGNSTDFRELNDFALKNDYKWTMGRANKRTLETLKITSRSTKMAIDKDGTIVYRAGIGQGTDQEWTSIFQQLSGP